MSQPALPAHAARPTLEHRKKTMGKKLFKLFKDPAAKPDGPAKAGVVVPRGEEASATGSRMRDLIRSHYSPEQVALLKNLIDSREGAAKYSDSPILVQDVIDPGADMLKIVSEEHGLRMIDLKRYPRADYRLRGLIPAERAKALRVIPVEEKEDGTVVVAIADPSNPTVGDDLRLILGRDVETVIADESEIDERIEQYYGMGDESLEDIISQQETETVDEDVITTAENAIDLTDPESLGGDQPIVQLVNLLLLRAIEDRASDIHIEPFPTFIRVRYRVDGVLREMPSPPRSQLVAIVSRIKVMANLNISETRKPQDGRIKLLADGREIDMRISCMPTVHGEAVVMRVLDKSMMMIGISQIGMLPDVLEDFKKVIRRPHGIVLVTGPTGCGKTTTLYAALAEVRDPGEKFITTEDPVEYEMDGIQQVNINESVGLTFARCLRAILRQDPDTVLVGEIRDVETAQIAVQAALTGHLVFSTLHTNSAAATVTRLLDMGVEPFLITSAVEGVIGQRLVRTICQSCKTEVEPDEDELADFGLTLKEVRDEGIRFFRGQGCEECNHTGYHGRLGIFELMEFTDEVRELVLERATTDEIHELAVRQGMITMRQDGWAKVTMGLTTMSEVLRQTPAEVITTAKSSSILVEREGEGPVEGREALPSPQEALPAPNEALPAPGKPKLSAKSMIVENEEAASANAKNK